jgi:hypothetical protein
MLIIVYHVDEKNGIPYAQLLFEKGYNNIFLISGGHFNIFFILNSITISYKKPS